MFTLRAAFKYALTTTQETLFTNQITGSSSDLCLFVIVPVPARITLKLLQLPCFSCVVCFTLSYHEQEQQERFFILHPTKHPSLIIVVAPKFVPCQLAILVSIKKTLCLFIINDIADCITDKNSMSGIFGPSVIRPKMVINLTTFGDDEGVA